MEFAKEPCGAVGLTWILLRQCKAHKGMSAASKVALKTSEPWKTWISILEGIFLRWLSSNSKGHKLQKMKFEAPKPLGAGKEVIRGLQGKTAPNQLLESYRCPAVKSIWVGNRAGAGRLEAKEKLLFGIVLQHIRNWTADCNEGCQELLWACIFSKHSDCAKRLSTFLWGVDLQGLRWRIWIAKAGICSRKAKICLAWRLCVSIRILSPH